MTDRSKALLVMDKKHLENRMHTIILDAGPIIKGQPPVSTLLQQCEQLVSSPSVVSEIRDQETRTRLETTVLPFLQLRTPKPDSIKFVSDFARKTGDLAVLSSTDIRLLALAYDVECERNGGDWRLRRTPGQKRTNGPPPANLNLNQEGKSTEDVPEIKSEDVNAVQSGQDPIEQPAVAKTTPNVIELPDEDSNIADCVSKEATGEDYNSSVSNQDEQLAKQLEAVRLSAEEITQAEETSEDSDSDDWITPSNLKRKQNEDTNGDSSGASEPKIMQVVS
jgi:RNA-binding protein NOB1